MVERTATMRGVSRLNLAAAIMGDRLSLMSKVDIKRIKCPRKATEKVLGCHGDCFIAVFLHFSAKICDCLH